MTPPATKEPESIAADEAGAADANSQSPGRKILIRTVLVIVLVLGLVFGTRAWLHARTWAGTDDAFFAAHIQQISSRIAARVESVPVKDNQMVRAGQLLVKLDDRDLQVAIQQSEAKLKAAQAGVAKAEAQQLMAKSGAAQAAAQFTSSRARSKNSEIELARTKKLRASGAVAQQALDDAIEDSLTDRADMVAAEKQEGSFRAGIRYTAAAIQSAKAAVAVAKANLQQAKLNLSYATIRAKQDGRVTVKSVEPGNYVQPGQALMAIVSSDVWVEANYKETQLKRIKPGQKVIVRVDAYPGLELHGHVDSIQAGSGAQFSLFPPENASGNYVKVVQRVPVKIVLDLTGNDLPLLSPGLSVIPEIRVR